MPRRNATDSQTNVPAQPAGATAGRGGSRPQLRGLDSNPQGAFGPGFWQAFCASAVRFFDALSLPHPSEKDRFTLSTRSYATPRGTLMRSQGTAFIVMRGPAVAARGPDQLLVVLQTEGSAEGDYGGRHMRREPGDVTIVDYARPFRIASTDYVTLIIVLTRDSVPASLLEARPHGLLFPRGSGAAHLIGGAMKEFYAQADDLTVSEAESAIDGIVALTSACARATLAVDEADHVKSRRRAALDYIDAHLGDAKLGPDEIANAANVSRASLYRLLAAEGGIRNMLLKRRLDEAIRLMLADNVDERSLKEIARCCGFAGMSQFTRAFHTRFGLPPRRYRALVRQQDRDWQEARLVADGFDKDDLLWRPQGLCESAALERGMVQRAARIIQRSRRDHAKFGEPVFLTL
jgi:AraC-like DNA-binding protein